jgi:diguanylate cyclase
MARSSSPTNPAYRLPPADEPARATTKRRDVLGRLLASNRRLRALADQDPLTGTLNRRGLMRCLERLCQGDGFSAPVLLIDCDDFKAVNELHGHAVGDAALMELVHRIRGSVRDRDPVTRLGGDEFLVLLPHTNIRAAERIGRQICDRVSASPITVGSTAIEVTVSIGVAEANLERASIEPLLGATRAALRRSKSEGKNRASWTPDQSGAHVRGDCDSLLPRLSECMVDHQPIVSLDAGAVLGYEWWIRGPTAELSAPADLFRAARAIGAEAHVDLSCLRATTAGALRSSFPGRVHLNVLPETLTAELDAVLHLLEPLKSAGRRVVVEMSLERLGRCSEALLDSARSLSSAGYEIALEDAGHGSTSLDAILALSPTILKVRRAWVSALGERRPEAVRRARALRCMADALGIELGVIGIEHAAELEVVRALGFQAAQGYLFSARARRS